MRRSERISSYAIPLVGQMGLCLYRTASGSASAVTTSASVAILCMFKRSPVLPEHLWQAQALYQEGEPRVGAQRLQHRLDPQVRQPATPLAVGLLQASERLIQLTKRDVKTTEGHR